MKKYIVNTTFYCNSLKKYISAGAYIYRSEVSSKLIINGSSDSNNNSNSTISKFEYTSPNEIAWFDELASSSNLVSLESTYPETITGIGPQGATGFQGFQGFQGPQGATGVAGTTDYDSLSNKPTLELEFCNVKCASVVNHSQLSSTEILVDGLVLNVGDKVLIRMQNSASQNGVYIVSNGAWTKILSKSVSVNNGTLKFKFYYLLGNNYYEDVLSTSLAGIEGWITENPKSVYYGTNADVFALGLSLYNSGDVLTGTVLGRSVRMPEDIYLTFPFSIGMDTNGMIGSVNLRGFSDTGFVTLVFNGMELGSIRFPPLTQGLIQVVNCKLSAAALNQMFMDLGTVSGKGIIFIGGNTGISNCNTTIATSKGWVVQSF